MKKIKRNFVKNILQSNNYKNKKILFVKNVKFDLRYEDNTNIIELVLPYPVLKNEMKFYENFFWDQIKNEYPNSKIEVKFETPAYSTNHKKNISSIKNVIAVSSGKGGVGKSTIASNIAFAMKSQGAKVGILDLDIYGPSIPLILSTKNIIPKYTNNKINPIEIFGIQTMSIGNLIDYDSPIVWRGPMVSSAVNKLFYDTNWKSLDYLIIDLPPGTGDIHLTLIKNIPITGSILVSTPQSLSVFDTIKAYHMFYKTKIPILGIVENMSYFNCDSCQKKHNIFDKDLNKKFKNYKISKLISLPIDVSLRQKSDNGNIKDIYYLKKNISYKFIKLSKMIFHKINLLPISDYINKKKFFAEIND